MLGAEGVSTAIIHKVRDHSPAKIRELRTRYGVDKNELPLPAALYTTDQDALSIEDYPAIICTTVDTTGKIGNKQLTSTGEVDVYQYKYRMRIFVYVTGVDHTTTDLLRKRFMLAVREILLTDLILVDGGGQYAELETTTVKESYSEVARNDDSQLFAGAFIEFEVKTAETIKAFPAPVPGDVEIIQDVELIPGGILVNP